jgi:Transcriptional regulator
VLEKLNNSETPKGVVLEKRGPGRPRDTQLTSQRTQEILDVSTELFAKKGFASTDVQEIADRLGIAKGTIYHYFQSKEKLFLASVDRGMEMLSLEINRSVAGIEDPVEQIVLAIKAFLSYFDRNPYIVELIVQERAEFRDRKKPTYLEHRERNIKPWNMLFQGLSESGRFRNLNFDEVTQTISNLLYGTIFTTYFARHGQSFESTCPQILSLVFAGIMNEEERVKLESYIK